MRDDQKVLTSRLSKRAEGLTAGKTIWQYVDARIEEILRDVGDIDFVVSHLTQFIIASLFALPTPIF
jgi:hypothetical protein